MIQQHTTATINRTNPNSSSSILLSHPPREEVYNEPISYMSLPQSRSDKSDSQNRKLGRSGSSGNQQRNFKAPHGGGGNGGAASAVPPTAASSFSSNKSFKKTNNAQGGQSRTNTPYVNAESSYAPAPQRNVQNGAALQPSSHATEVSAAGVSVKQIESSLTQKVNRAVPKAPAPQPASVNPSSVAPTTPAKPQGDAPPGYLQFGSLSPGFIQGMQIPPRTSSAPPNFDEQKKAQARHESSKPGSISSTPAPMLQVPKKETDMADRSKTVEALPTPNANKVNEVSSTPIIAQTQKTSVVQIPAPVQFHQSQLHVQSAPSNPQVQTQGILSAPIQMQAPIQLPPNATPTPQHMFVPNLQHHQMQHQRQNLGFRPQMGPPITAHQGNYGIGMNQQFQPHLAGEFVGSRRPVKITDPKTREDVPLVKWTDAYSEGGLAAQKSQLNGQQPQNAFLSPHPINYYPSAFNANPHFYQAPGPMPLPSAQFTSSPRPGRFNYSVSQRPQPVPYASPSPLNSYSASKPGAFPVISRPPGADRSRDLHNSTPSLATVPVSVKPAPSSASKKVTDSSPQISSGFQKGDSPKLLRPLGEGSAKPVVDVSVGTSTSTVMEPSPVSSTIKAESSKVQTNTRSSLINDSQKQDERSYSQLGQQVSGQSMISSNSNTEAASVPTSATGGALESTTSEVSESISGGVGEVESAIHKPDRLFGSSHTVNSDESHRNEKQIQLQDGGQKTENVETKENEGLEDLPVEDTCDIQNIICNDSGSARVVTKDHNPTLLPNPLVLSNSLDSNSITLSKVFSIVSTNEDLAPVSDTTVSTNSRQVSVSELESKDKPSIELSPSKSNLNKSKKMMEVLQREDAAGTTCDLYMTYKGPDEKKDVTISTESMPGNIGPKHVSSDPAVKENVASDPVEHSKVGPDDWKDAADMYTPKLDTSNSRDNGIEMAESVNENMTKKYSRDFLLTFKDHCVDMPEDIDINAVDALFVSSRPSPGRVVDRPSGPSRSDRRLNVVEDKWNKISGNFVPGRDLQPESGYGSHMVRPGQRNNFGVSTYHPRSSGPILSGPMQLSGSHGVHRNSPDERWQRAKGLISSPHTPLQVMHRAENKYEIGKVSDEEEAKQRQLKAILNKLTPNNFEKLFEKVKAVNVDNAVTLSGCISQIYDKALNEPTFCEMYANFCHHLDGELPELSEDDKKVTFKRLLLNKCQEEFERGELEQEEANRAEDGEIKLSKEERETKRVQARRRMLGNIKFIGELYKKKMLTERIMHSCINKLLGQHEDPEEEDIESLCNLMSTIGEIIDHPKAKEHMDAYFDIMGNLSNNMRLSSRVRFMLKGAIDLRRNKWQQRRKVEGPKKIDEVHKDAAKERTAQANRLQSRPTMSSSVRRTAPNDFGQRSSPMLPSPNSQMGNFRGYPPQFRGHGNQDVRSDERQSYEARHMSVPLPQRPVGNDSITLGPQGGLARGMSSRGQQSTAELSPGHGDFRRMPGVVNGYNTSSERTYDSREIFSSRQVSERYVVPSDRSSGEEHYIPPGNRAGHNFEPPLATSPPASLVQEPINNLSEASLPEDHLLEKSITVIKEYYSAEDENEVSLCIKELNSPSFHSTMISLWVTDSFERKDKERDLLAKLLVSLVKSQDGLLTQTHLLKGFESVLATLEDAVNDAPKAAEFLGRILAKSVLEDVLSIETIGDLIYTGGEEPGSLVEIGLAADVFGTILEMIKTEQGDDALKEMRSSTKLRWEDFRPPGSIKSRKLEQFI